MAQEHPHQETLGEYGEFSIQGYHQAAAAAAGGGGGHELYSLQSRMEMLELPAKHHHQHPSHHNSEASWGFHHLHHHHHHNHHHNPETSSSSFVDDSLRCLFPVHEEGEEQPSQGLSLSLYNPDPSVADYQRSILFSRQGSSNSTVSLHQGVAFHGEAAAASTYHKLRLSKYLIPAQELLNEFCFLGGGPKGAVLKQNQQSRRPEEGASPVNSHPSLHCLDILELQKRKAKLLNLLEEVDRRYRRYCEQMRAVVSSFEAVAGEGAATAYLDLASRAMSRHFRTLRDGIANQVQAAKKAVGEKDSIAPGISRGETPRLKVLDQCFRQHKAFQHGAAGMLPDHHPWRPQRGLPERSVSILRAWLFEHFLHPYPSDVDKHILARQTGLSRSQVSNWFINARVRLWKPMIEEMYTEELKEHELQSCATARGQHDDPSCSRDHAAAAEDQKPLPARLLAEPDSLSSVVNQHSEPRSHHSNPLQRAENYGIVDIDFSSYDGCGGGGGAVSLTLGLHHPDGGAIGFSVTPATQEQPPLFYTRGQMEEYQPVQFSLLDGEVQNLPYRNLMGAQLLHDLAG